MKNYIRKIARTFSMMMAIVLTVAALGSTVAMAAEYDPPISIQPVSMISIQHELAVSAVTHAIETKGLIEDWEMADILTWTESQTTLYHFTNPEGTVDYRYYELVPSMCNILIRTEGADQQVIAYGFTDVDPDTNWLIGGFLYKLEIPTVSIQPVPEDEVHIW